MFRLLALGLLILSVSCGSAKSTKQVGTNPCEGQNPPAGCGLACDSSPSGCGSGLYCSAENLCTADCDLRSGTGCGDGKVCGFDGRCQNLLADGGMCVGLQCQQVACTNGTTTTITGKVYTPAGNLPLYNALVYVPNAPLAPFSPGVTCGACGAVASGSPVVSAVTGPDGSFTLENVPAGDNIPLVLQMGRWRRQVTIPKVEPCVSTPLTDVEMLRLPRTKEEGDIPLMAIATGDADPFECLLRKIGIADSEITLPSGEGRVHFYRQNGKDMSPSAPRGRDLFNSLNTLKKYDVVMLPCEGDEYEKSRTATRNIIDYTSLGGRVFATHFSYVWIHGPKDGPLVQDPFPSTGEWDVNQGHPEDPFPFTGTVNTSFPKGLAFSQWLQNVGATTTAGQLDIIEARHDINAVNDPPSKRWISGTFGAGPDPDAVMHLTFNTPINPTETTDAGEPIQCGRVVFSDFHVSATALSGEDTFPASCNNDELTPQEKALVFMLFDLAACVQSDDEAPVPLG